MATPKWDSLGDEHGSHPMIMDPKLASAEPYEYCDDVDFYHEKHSIGSKGKLMVKDKNGKMRRTAIGEGLFCAQTKLNNKIMRHGHLRLMKRTAPTKADFFYRTRRQRFLASKASGGRYKAYGVADAPSPQNINAVRRKIYATYHEPRDVIAPLNSTSKKVEIPANVALFAEKSLADSEFGDMSNPQAQVMVTLQDGVEPGTMGEHPEENSKERTVMFATHGVVNLACDPAAMKMFRIGDYVMLEHRKTMTHANSNELQHGIVPFLPMDKFPLQKLGTYLGPCSGNIRGGICVRLDGES